MIEWKQVQYVEYKLWKIESPPSHLSPWRTRPKSISPQWSQNAGARYECTFNAWGRIWKSSDVTAAAEHTTKSQKEDISDNCSLNCLNCHSNPACFMKVNMRHFKNKYINKLKETQYAIMVHVQWMYRELYLQHFKVWKCNFQQISVIFFTKTFTVNFKKYIFYCTFFKICSGIENWSENILMQIWKLKNYFQHLKLRVSWRDIIVSSHLYQICYFNILSQHFCWLHLIFNFGYWTSG